MAGNSYQIIWYYKISCQTKLPLHGQIENDTSINRGNCLELVHLIAKYDPVLREYLVRSKMCVKISIQNELIAILGNNLRHHIITQIKKPSIIRLYFESTTDLSHKYQTS